MRIALLFIAAALTFSTASLTLADSFDSRLKQELPGSGNKNKLNQNDAAGGIKEALAQGVNRAILQLGREDGFNTDPVVRILVPDKLQQLANTARRLGAGKKVDQFELSMNRAAEKAIPLAADVFADAVRQMTITDAINIVRGDQDAGTQFFRRVTENKLREQFMPIVADATAKTGVTKSYKKMAGQNASIAKLLGGGESIDLDRYVTDKAMDGLYHYVAEQEKEIRKNPLQQSSSLLRRVFRR